MAYQSRTFIIVIASPSDLPEERQAVKQAIYDWNDLHAEAEGVQLQPKMWETHTTPEVGRPQGVVNHQLIDSADLLIGMFWTKLGTDTGVAESGTVEEINRIVAAGKQAHLYFSKRLIDPSKIDTKQMDRLKSFQEETYKKALVKTFASPEELRRTVLDDLTRRVRMMKTADAQAVAASDIAKEKREIATRRKDIREAQELFIKRLRDGAFYEMPVIPPLLALSITPQDLLDTEIDVKASENKLNLGFPPLHTRGWDRTFGRKAMATLSYTQDPESGQRKPPQTVTEITSNGVVFAACWFYWSYEATKDRPYPFHGDEDEIIRRCGEYMFSLKDGLGVKPPYYLMLSLLGVKGMSFYINEHRGTRKISTDDITVGPIEIPDTSLLPNYSERVYSIATCLQPAFDEIWQEAGLSGSPYYSKGRFQFSASGS